MAQPDTLYCTQCGNAGTRGSAYCPNCGMPRQLAPQRRAGHVAFVLNELHESPMREVVTAQQRSRLETHYEDELRRYIEPRRTRRHPPVMATTAATPASAAAAPSITLPPPPPPRAPAPPRQPYDWSWLAEQQANLFLFAGAFLTVVAALIYVGYNEQTIDGSLKMGLLVGYTLAFLGTGWFCLRNPRVEIAGRVFFGVGALLVPMNFAAARSILSDEDLSAETMWLAGSLTTAAFYAAVAWLGLGRLYAIGAGAALISGSIAAAVATDMAPEWAPLLFIGVALAMTLTKHTDNKRIRERIGTTWDLMGQAFGAGALGVALIMALMAIGDSGDGEEFVFLDETTLWFLPVTLAVFTAAAGLLAVLRKQEYLGATALAALAGTGVSIAYALELPAEGWVVVFAAVAAAFGALLLAVEDGRIAKMLPAKVDEYVFGFGVGLTALGAMIALFVLQAAHGDEVTYDLRTPWFLALSAALALAFYMIAALSKRGRTAGADAVAAFGAMAMFAATGISVAYGFELPGEGWVMTAGAVSAAFGVVLLVVQQKRVARLLPAKFGDYAFGFGVGMTALGATTALFVLQAAHGDDPAMYTVRTPWFLASSAALALAFYVLAAASKRGRTDGIATVVSLGIMSTFAATWVAVIYGFELRAEGYAIGIAAMAPILGLALIAAQDKRIARFVPKHLDDAAYVTAIGGTIVSAMVTLAVLVASHEEVDPYVISNKWLLLAVAPLSALFYAVDAQMLQRRIGVPGLAVALAGVCASVVYAIDASAEYYAFTPIVPAIALIAAVRWAPSRLTSHLHVKWREDIVWLGRIGASVGVVVALMAVTAGADENVVWQPQSHFFLPAAFFAAAVFFGIDASRERRIETSLAFVAALGAAAVTVPYAFFADAQYYGVALVATGIIFAASGRIWPQTWLHEEARDGLAVLAIAASTLPFERVYADVPMIGAGVHLAAAFCFAIAAMSDRSERTLGSLLDMKDDLKIKVSAAWLYAASLCAGIGYVFTLRAIAGDKPVEGAELAIPMLAASLALMATGIATKAFRPDFRLHFYLMSLGAALVSIATSGDAGTLALVMTVFVGAYAAIAIIEDTPAFAAPSVLFGFVAVAAWRAHLDESFAVLPIAYALAGMAAYCWAIAIGDKRPRWSMALRAVGATYALVAPAAGFGVLSAQSDAGLVDGQSFARTALYQASTLAVAAVGLLALIESLLAGRKWIIVPASAVMTVALLLQIGRFDPENPQVYTAVVGSYLVLLGLVGLSRMRLIPELAEYGVYIEALGAATVMLPSFVQSIDAGWRYQWILLIEATVFLAGGIALRRRGILSAGVVFMVLVAGRTLLDAINAMPNWIVVALCGIGLLGIGMGILLGRERWDRWQRTVVSWWESAGNGEGTAAT